MNPTKCSYKFFFESERSSDSYIGRDDFFAFFPCYVLKFVPAQIYIFAV